MVVFHFACVSINTNNVYVQIASISTIAINMFNINAGVLLPVIPNRFRLSGSPTDGFHADLRTVPVHPLLENSPSCAALRHAIVVTRQISAQTVIQTSIALARVAQAHCNFLVDECFERAVEEARALDRAVEEALASAPSSSPPPTSNDLLFPPFAGVPLLVKESFAVENTKYTYGLSNSSSRTACQDAPVVSRLRHLGFIVVGTTNVSESCMWAESYNTVFGRSLNPLDLSRTPGGSSGGSAVGVGSHVCPVAVTADVGGSTRIPAMCCGLFGHKPSGGLLPNTGTHHDVCIHKICRICQPGLVARSPRDLRDLIFYLGMPGAGEVNLRGEIKEAMITKDDDPRNYEHYRNVGRKCNPGWAALVGAGVGGGGGGGGGGLRRRHLLKRIFVLMPTWERTRTNVSKNGFFDTRPSTEPRPRSWFDTVPSKDVLRLLSTRVVCTWSNFLIRVLMSTCPADMQEEINDVVDDVFSVGGGAAIDFSDKVYLEDVTLPRRGPSPSPKACSSLEIIPVSLAELEADWWFLLWAARLGHNEEKAFACKIGLLDAKWDYHEPSSSTASGSRISSAPREKEILNRILRAIIPFFIFAAAVLRWICGFSPHTFPALALAIFDWYLVSDAQNQYLDGRAKLLRRKMERLLATTTTGKADETRSEQGQSGCQSAGKNCEEDRGEQDRVEEHHSVLVMPTLPWCAAPWHDEMLPGFLNTAYTSVWNCLELPATAVPIDTSAPASEYGPQDGPRGVELPATAVPIDTSAPSSEYGPQDGSASSSRERSGQKYLLGSSALGKDDFVLKKEACGRADTRRNLPGSMQIVGLRDEITLSVAVLLHERCRKVRAASILGGGIMKA